MKFVLSIFYPVLASAPTGFVTEVHVFTIGVNQCIEWVRHHADELAVQISKGRVYTALMVDGPTDQPDT